MALDHELPEASVVPVVQRPRRLLRPEDLRDDVPRPPEDGLVLVAALSLPPQLAQDLPLRLPQARLAESLGGLVAVPGFNGFISSTLIQFIFLTIDPTLCKCY